MAANKSDILSNNSASTDQTSTKEISLEDLGGIHGGSALDQMRILKSFKTKDGAYARLEISLMNNFITRAEYDELYPRIKYSPWWI